MFLSLSRTGRSSSSKSHGFVWQALAVAAAWFLCAPVQAQIIIRDTFTGGVDGDEITNRVPDTVDLPGGSWQRHSVQASFRTTATAGFGNPLPGAFGQEQNASGISLASFGAYLKPTKLTISMDLSAGQVIGILPPITGAASAGRGMALGFFSSMGSQSFSQNLFTGLVVDATGAISLVKDPNAAGFFDAGSTILPSVAFGGTYDPSQLSNLSYTVDTSTGAISGIHFGSSTANYSSLEGGTFFAGGATALAGMYSSSQDGGRFGAADNFQVSAVPEPASLGLLAFGGLWLCGRRARTRR